MKNDDCIFCKIANGESPCYKIFENDYVLAFLDISKDCFGHTLVVPKKHFENMLDCNDKYLAECAKAVKKISNHYVNDCGFDGVNVLNASGKCAEQTVMHLHFHIIPRKNNDNMHTFPKFDGTNVDFEKQLEMLKM